ncbi:hypothetical protein [Loigolactobacillus bifermentans]|uniref:hypothetical protein n=1 Tax=Loigolactobacillus bifermentans TaxID=1607 RepID=UPI0012AAAC2E|nr:hypothetical protein [Loigolactobacillus bifermentans]QGG61463.1 hypothetical protein LB003_13810 [Loigolactobacillus bifermentans]
MLNSKSKLSNFSIALHSWNQVIYLVLMGFNLLAVYFKLRLKQRLNSAERFILLTILGIGAFHMFFWEGEARYVYLILPFLLFGAGTGIQQTIKQTIPQRVVQHQRIWQLGFGVLCILLMLGGTWQSRGLLQPQSQLTPQIMQNKTYGTIQLAQNKTVTQGFTLQQTANQVIWQNKTGQPSNQLQVTLENVGTKQKWHLSQNKAATAWQLHQKMHPGQYRLRILNRGGKTIKLTLLKSHHYHAIPQMQSLQSDPWQQQYLVLTVGWQQMQPVLSRIGLVVLDLVLLGGSLVSFKWYLRSTC